MSRSTQCDTARAPLPWRRAASAPAATGAYSRAAVTASRAGSACACGGTCPRCQRPERSTTHSRQSDQHRAFEQEAENTADRTVARLRAHGTFDSRSTPNSSTALSRVSKPMTNPDAITGIKASVTEAFDAPLSSVRIHDDAQSATLSHALRAHAFTVGTDIFVGRGGLRPHTPEGAHLLAHELTHVVQQQRHGSMLQRSPYDVSERGTEDMHEQLGEQYADSLGMPNLGAVQYTEGYRQWLQSRAAANVRFVPPRFNHHNPLHRLGAGLPAGYTDLTVNGRSINPPGSPLNTYLTNLQAQLAPASIAYSPGTMTGQVACRFDPSFTIETSTVVDEASPAPPGGWTAQLPPASVGAAAACPGKASVPVTLRGTPSDAAYEQLIHSSEMEHVADLRTLHDRHLVPHYDFITRLSATAGSNSDCEQRLRAQLGKRVEQTSIAFALADLAEARKLDDPASTHVGNLTPTVSAGCPMVTLTASPRNALIPGAGPGNVQPVRPVRTPIDTLQLSISGTTLMSGTTTVRTFASLADASTAMAIFAALGVDEILAIGQVEVLMNKGQIASGSLTGIAGRVIDPARYQVTIGVPNAADWVISQVDGEQFFEIINFHARRDDAFSAVALLRQHQATHQSWLGQAASPQMVFFTA